MNCSVVDQMTKYKYKGEYNIYICIGEVGGVFFRGQEPSLELVLDCVIERFPFTDWENMSSEPFFAVMSREQVLRLQNCVVSFKLIVSWRLSVRLS